MPSQRGWTTTCQPTLRESWERNADDRLVETNQRGPDYFVQQILSHSNF